MSDDLNGVTLDQLRADHGRLKQREGDQQLPRANDLPCIQDLVSDDVAARKAVGLARYGTPLQPHNGRDVLRDAYEEALDLVMYLRQLMWERDNPLPAPDKDVPPPNGWTCGPHCRSRGHDGPQDVCL